MKRIAPIEGAEYLWHPVPMVGKDGVLYQVYALFASGRGWASTQYLVRKDLSNKPIKVQVLPAYWYSDVKGAVCVKLLDCIEDEFLTFKKNPYVRKDGSFTVVDPARIAIDPTHDMLAQQYAVTRTDYEWFWQEKDGKPSHAHQYYQKLIDDGYFHQDEKAYFTTLVVKPGQLTSL